MKPIIIYPPTIDWDHLHQRPQQLLKALSQLGCACVFCNINMHKRYSTGFSYLNDNLVLANGVSFNNALQWCRNSYPQSPLIAYFTYPTHIESIQEAAVDLILFDSVDEPLGEFASWLPSYSKAVQNSNLVIASAQSLVKRAAQHTASEVHLIPNGCDYHHFQAAQTRHAIDCPPFNRGKPIIGYIGAIAPWLDRELINEMGRCLPGCEFVFIGPLLQQKGMAFTSSNMHYLGPKNYADLPCYMSNFDYCLIPFKLTEMTRGVNPVKFWEYLASGHPILSTALPEIPKEFVTIITSAALPQIPLELNDRGKDARITLARNNSWTERATNLLLIICRALECG
ncbi:MAG: glycosyltransferase family 1 protein [Sporomusaceae bacterium]|nr:glycosyltransferase family 1 protein [Sporomusaceae bacterium]